MDKELMNKKADLRAACYKGFTEYLLSVGDSVEPSCKGILVYDPDRDLYFEVSVTVKDETKFDLAKARSEYAKKAENAVKRAEKARIAAEEKERKAAERAAKAKQKIANS